MMPTPGNFHPTLRAVKMGLFPTMGSLQEVVDLADSKLPISSRNELVAILMTYHNTLIQQIQAP